MYPLIDKPFRCIDIYSRKAFVALWVQPLTEISVLKDIHETVTFPILLFHYKYNPDVLCKDQINSQYRYAQEIA